MTAAIKCVCWDLDETLWNGTLRDGDPVRIAQETRDLVHLLEQKGIAQSIVSKNDRDDGIEALHHFGIGNVFVYPQISWSAKSSSVARIVEWLNIGADSVVLIDDSDFERAEVASRWPEVRCFSLPEFLRSQEFAALSSLSVSEEAAKRPQSYRDEARRQSAEATFSGTPLEFLASTDMKLTLRLATPEDRDRAVELARRTNQFNSTGLALTNAMFDEISGAKDRHILLAELSDKFGDYGRIALCVASLKESSVLLDLFLMSCRVAGRDIGRAVLGAIGAEIARPSMALQCRFTPTGRNRQMQIMLAMQGFFPTNNDSQGTIYEHKCPANIAVPSYISVTNTVDLLSNNDILRG